MVKKRKQNIRRTRKGKGISKNLRSKLRITDRDTEF